MKKCELCSKAARMYCESDDASLCWDCDSRVHAANFLVAKHTRTLLCHACQSPTPWSGSGPKLGPTVSACQACDTNGVEDEDEDEDEDDDDDEEEEEEEEENGDLANEDEDDDENQVVPLSLASTSTSTSNSTSTTSGSEGSSVTRDGLPNSSFGLSTNASFFNEVSGREEEEDGGKKMRSWMWR